MEIPDTLVAQLIKTAKRSMWSDDEGFCALDASGGNYDDAYSYGCTDGEISMAREILDALKVPYTQ